VFCFPKSGINENGGKMYLLMGLEEGFDDTMQTAHDQSVDSGNRIITFSVKDLQL